MSFDTRNNSAMSKRAEQLKRWEESETNREPNVPKNTTGRKIKFSSGCVFLAACMSGDKEEVIRLLDNGADIDTANVDGLTALHQVSFIFYYILPITIPRSKKKKTKTATKNNVNCFELVLVFIKIGTIYFFR